MIRLPVSGIEVRLRLPNGADEMALSEGDPAPVAAGLQMLDRLATAADGGVGDWARLPVTDFEVMLLQLRKRLVGDRISSHVACPACRERVEISFLIDDYVAAVRPVAPAGLGSGPQDGWLHLDGAAFRLPTAGDLLAVRYAPNPGEALRKLCLAPRMAAPIRRRIEAAVGRLAPQVTGHVGGACPECGAALQALFDVVWHVVAELRRLAAGVHAQVHELAAAYGWDEAAILALPGPRRRRYAELVRDAGSRRPMVA